MLGGGPSRYRRPRILFFLSLLCSMLVFRSPPTIPTVKSVSPVSSVRTRYLVSIIDSTFPLSQTAGRSQLTKTGGIFLSGIVSIYSAIEITARAQISPFPSSNLTHLKRLSSPPVTVCVLSRERRLSPPYRDLCLNLLTGLGISVSHGANTLESSLKKCTCSCSCGNAPCLSPERRMLFFVGWNYKHTPSEVNDCCVAPLKTNLMTCLQTLPATSDGILENNVSSNSKPLKSGIQCFHRQFQDKGHDNWAKERHDDSTKVDHSQ